MTRTLIVPGLDGSSDPHWQHWWTEVDPSAVMVDLTDCDRPDPAVWEIELAGAILASPGAILVGHSLGAVLIARLLAAWPHLPVSGALLVAPADPRHDPRLAPFVPLSQAPLGVPATVVASRNDPWMSFSQAAELAKNWRADLVDLGFAGHINVASGFGPWHEGLRLRDALRQQAMQPPYHNVAAARVAGWRF